MFPPFGQYGYIAIIGVEILLIAASYFCQQLVMERALGDSYANNGWSSPHGYIRCVCVCVFVLVYGGEKECSLGAHAHTRTRTIARHLKRNRSGALGLNNNRAVARPMFWPEGENRFF